MSAGPPPARPVPRPAAAEPSQALFRFSTRPVISFYCSSPFPAVRPVRRELCIFVPSLVPRAGRPKRCPRSARTAWESCARPLRDASGCSRPCLLHLPDPRNARSGPAKEALRKKSEFQRKRREELPGLWRGKGADERPERRVALGLGGLSPAPGGLQEPFLLLQRPLGQGREDPAWGADGTPGTERSSLPALGPQLPGLLL